jgi:hypothetical protein
MSTVYLVTRTGDRLVDELNDNLIGQIIGRAQIRLVPILG